ncbi:MAG: permease [Planctomycetes bacterium]|nr:permease [Planctomycetota bacterium]
MFDALADLLVFRLGGLSADTPFGAALHFFVMDVVKILVLLSGIIYVMGLLRTMLAPERVRDFVKGRPAFVARGLAVVLGAVTPFCSCSSVPLFIGFVEAGIPLGVTLSFLIASPMINEVAVVLLAGVIGWKLTALYVVTGMTVAFVGGIVLERFRPERWVEPYVFQMQVGAAPVVAEDRSFRARRVFAAGQVREILGRVWKFVLVGVGVGAAIHGYVPQDFLAGLTKDGGVLSVASAVAIGVPLYSDAVGIVPIAQALLSKGVPIGTVLAFMMAVTALSLPEMIILRKVVRWPLLGLFAAYLAIAFIGVGLVFNAIGLVPVH